ncbi:hypothetical protein GCM10009839_03100 [Catenulispora yoronensis]|uniref:Uncharacterized protein n=1 Tax=Catenulispora yoronensis TaxID=450799 RepID=A0ABP5F1S5_9ACTN
MNNTLFTLDIAKSRNADLILAAKRYRLAKLTARHARGKSPDKVHSVRRSAHSDETPMT